MGRANVGGLVLSRSIAAGIAAAADGIGDVGISMSSEPTVVALPTPSKMDPAAALLSYLIPGLGQLVQGRIAKGLVFFVGVYGLFFYGQFLGQGRNVYFGDTTTPAQQAWKAPKLIVNLFNRPQFAGQVWIGMAAWPAIYHYWNDAPVESPQHRAVIEQLDTLGWLQRTQVALPEEKINDLQRDGDKRWDLGWVYTVIAGVLNILVICDALAGPAFVPDAEQKKVSP